MAHKSERLSVRGVSVRSYRAGKGPTALFLHGAGGLPPVWLPFFEKLSQQFDLIVPEHPGFGASDDPGWIRNVPDLAMYYLDFLDAFDLRGVHLIGNSLGGWTAAEVAVRNCSRLASLTLLSPAGIRVKGVPVGDNFIWGPEEGVRNIYHDQNLAEAILKMVPSDEQAGQQLQNKLSATKFGWEPRWLNPFLEKWLHRISVPAHVVWGADDKLLPPAYARLWGERVPGAQVTIIEACGHLPHVEKADLAAAKVLAFLDRVAA